MATRRKKVTKEQAHDDVREQHADGEVSERPGQEEVVQEVNAEVLDEEGRVSQALMTLGLCEDIAQAEKRAKKMPSVDRGIILERARTMKPPE